MKVLIDENLSRFLADLLADVLPEITHVSELSLESKDDNTVFAVARNRGFDVVLTKDSDFVENVGRMGSPPKVIWVRLGNVSTSSVAKALRQALPQIVSFHNSDHLILEIY